ncbi:MAG: paraquat-inducible protein A [Bacteroidia bacterium]|nr:paraquat-inducible protein A [Bacteroidia bacterium]
MQESTLQQSKHKGLKQALLVICLTPILLYAIWCGYQIRSYSHERAAMRKDYSEVNNIQYGLLSVDKWKDNVFGIVNKQIDQFEFTPKMEDSLKQELNKVLGAVLNKAEKMVTKKQTTFKGRVTKFAVKNFVDVDGYKRKVPEFSQTIIDEIKKPSSKERLKFIVEGKLKEFADATHDSIDNAGRLRTIMAKYGSTEVHEFNKKLGERARNLNEQTYANTFIIIGCLSLFLLLWFIFRNRRNMYTPLFIMSVLLALVALITGLLAPMIEIDARIKELSFDLIGTHIMFNDQVIFFQSKSILDVVHILVTAGKADSIFVGILILIFSVVFPVTKLLSTKIYLLGNEKWKKNKFIYFFAFKSGKWSMADVMVVAIFMAYIGFKGILDNQIHNFNEKGKSLGAIGTSETSLQPGFILFIAYVIFGLILGVILKKITSEEKLGSRLKYYAQKLHVNKLFLNKKKRGQAEGGDVPPVNP